MTEPKYKIGQWLLNTMTNDMAIKVDCIKRSYPESVVYENETGYGLNQSIAQPVVIYPDYGEVFCKDCENWDKHTNADGEVFYEERSDDNCPVKRWLNTEIYIDDYRVDGADMQPPPNCHCFKPRAK